MKHFQVTSSIKKHSKIFVIFFVIVSSNLIFFSCSTVTQSTVTGTKTYYKRAENQNKPKYDYNILEKASIENPSIKLEITQQDYYKVKTKEFVTQKRKPSEFTIAFGVCSIIGGGITGYVATDDDERKIYGALFSAALGGLFTYGIILFNRNDTYRTNNKYDYYYKPAYPVINSTVSIFHSQNKILQKTNNLGILKFSPLYDFQINFADNNAPINFNLYVDYKNFESKLSLKPSTWLNEYAKIKESGATVWGSYNGRNSLGTLSKGLEYKIIPNSYTNNNLYKIELTPTKKGYISKFNVDTYYSTEKKSDVKLTIQEYIQEKISNWEKQGEFEHPADYKKRMLNYENKVQEWYAEATQLYQKEYINLINWEDAKISKYDPNNQTFKVNIPDLDTLIIHVPIDKALEFKGNWFIKKIKNQKFDFFSGDWELTSLEIEIPKTYAAKYNNETVLNYNPLTQFNLRFEELNLGFATNTQNNNTKKKNSELLTYDIKYNLPETKMSNPDAIAVVIGNANYQFIDNVKYALNDAQQIKTYLTSILGFKEENIIFENDVSKADFEKIFGTKNNFKGQLFYNVKPKKSDVFIFYSGHGAPGLNDKKGYFVPTDCDAQYIELQGYPIETLYENLGNIPSKSTTIIIDACFSGKGVIKNISSITVEPDMPKVFFENGALLTSSTGTEVATWANEMKHGLFTYFFLKAIHDYKNSDRDGDKKLTVKEIYNYISDESEGVPYYSGRINGFKQHPLISGANEDFVLVEF